MSVIQCPALDTTYSELNSTDTEFGVTVNISCSPGYRINGQTTATVHCTNTGHWSLNASCLRTSLHLTLRETKLSKDFCYLSYFFLWPPKVMGRPLYFPIVVSIFFFLFSSSILRGRSLDVYYHSSTHDVALVRI